MLEQMAELAYQKRSQEVGAIGFGQQAAGVTAAWIHASARRWDETWIPKYQRFLFLHAVGGRQRLQGVGASGMCP